MQYCNHRRSRYRFRLVHLAQSDLQAKRVMLSVYYSSYDSLMNNVMICTKRSFQNVLVVVIQCMFLREHYIRKIINCSSQIADPSRKKKQVREDSELPVSVIFVWNDLAHLSAGRDSREDSFERRFVREKIRFNELRTSSLDS